MHTNINFKTKKAFKEAVAAGQQIKLCAPALGPPKMNGTEVVVGPHHPGPNRWYAEVEVKNGLVVKVK